jgi:two-component system, NtrC family, sensor kinase
MFNRLSLKVALPLALAVTLVTFAITIGGTRYQRDRVAALARERGRNLSAITLDTIQAATPTGHRPNLQPFLEELAKNPDVAAVRVLSPEWKVTRSARPQDIGRDMIGDFMNARPADPSGAKDLLIDSQMTMHIVQPVPNAPQCHACHGTAPLLGYLDLELGVSQGADLSLWRFLGTVTGALQLLALLAITGIVTSVLVSRPIHRLAQAMERVRGGNLDVRVAPVGTREIDVVIAGFNSMVERLREAARREEETRRLQTERAEHLATVGEMAAGLAHEIRNPVAGVKAAVEVLASQLRADDPRRSILRESAEELDRVDEVIKSLLNFARPRPPAPKTVDLNTLVREAALFTAAPAAAERVEVSFVLRDSLPRVWVDPAMVRQVVVNLILNAVQAMAGYSAGRIVVSTDTRDGQVLCRVCDSGPGVAEAEAEAIFKPFVTSKPRGTGLGLSISRRLIELHGGRLWLENPGHPGACFVISVPLAADPGATLPGPGGQPLHRAEST